MITTAIVKKGGLYITDISNISKFKAKTVQVDITILDKPVAKPRKKKQFNPSDFRGLINIKKLKKEIRHIRDEWDRL